MKAATTATALALSLLAGIAADASAAGLELEQSQQAGHVMLTLKVSDLGDFMDLLGPAYDPDNPMTSLDNPLAEIGLTFTYSGWLDSPLMMGMTTAPGGVNFLGEVVGSNQRFSISFSYAAPFAPAIGSALVSFAVAAPSGDGKVDLTVLNMNPYTVDTGALTAGAGEPLASAVIAVPEPSTWLMLALGLGATGLARRTRR